MGQRLSGAEVLMWSAERDPVLRSSFLNVTVCDRPLDPDRFRRRLALAVQHLGRLRQVVVETGPRGTPEWQDDPAFSLEHHVRHVALPGPGSHAQLLELAARVLEDDLDKARPLWRMYIVDGLEGGRGALLAKLHHVVTDGVGGVRLSGSFIDLSRDQDEPTLPPARPAAPPDERPPTPAEALASLPVELARRAAGAVGALSGMASDPVGLPRDLLGTARTFVDPEPARSPLWSSAPRSLGRVASTLSLDLDAVKAAAKAAEGTVNDVFVAGTVAGVAAHHAARGAAVQQLRLSIPVNTRTDRSSGGNSFVPSRMTVPAHVDPRALLGTLRGVLAKGRQAPAGGILDQVAGIAATLPPPVIARLARQQTAGVDLVCSNVRGAPWPLFIAGAGIEHNFPLGPLAGTPCSATVLSTDRTLDLGLVTDPAAVDDPAAVRAAIVESFVTLLGQDAVRPDP